MKNQVRILNPGGKIPEGKSSYVKAITTNCCMVDKSLLIKEFLNFEDEVSIITRPRRFGKSMNMSMLKCFFEKPASDNKECKSIFNGTLISEYKDIMEKHHQKYPVIFLTFKEIRENNWEESYKRICKVLRYEILRHPESKLYKNLENKGFSEAETWNKIVNQELDKVSENDLKDSLVIFTKLLYLHHGVKPIILIDEFDTPINHAYLNTEKEHLELNDSYFSKMLSFMRSLLSQAFKDNDYLNRGLMVGILRLSKENFMTGLNNTGVSGLLSEKYMTHYGFLEPELDTL